MPGKKLEDLANTIDEIKNTADATASMAEILVSCIPENGPNGIPTGQILHGFFLTSRIEKRCKFLNGMEERCELEKVIQRIAEVNEQLKQELNRRLLPEYRF